MNRKFFNSASRIKEPVDSYSRLRERQRKRDEQHQIELMKDPVIVEQLRDIMHREKQAKLAAMELDIRLFWARLDEIDKQILYTAMINRILNEPIENLFYDPDND